MQLSPGINWVRHHGHAPWRQHILLGSLGTRLGSGCLGSGNETKFCLLIWRNFPFQLTAGSSCLQWERDKTTDQSTSREIPGQLRDQQLRAARCVWAPLSIPHSTTYPSPLPWIIEQLLVGPSSIERVVVGYIPVNDSRLVYRSCEDDNTTWIGTWASQHSHDHYIISLAHYITAVGVVVL